VAHRTEGLAAQGLAHVRVYSPFMTGSPLIVGRYALFGEIAAGGMATVQLGRFIGPAGFARTVAVKRLHRAFAADPDVAAMLLDEARLTADIRHPNVVATLDVIQTDAELLIVMEYVHGESLARLRDRGPVPLGVAAAVVSGALHGLGAAHESRSARGTARGVVHRDVSPQNILVGVDGVARIADFGVAKALGRAQHTRDGQLKGKLAYMAPEQIRGEEVDRRADVYAAAVVLWELLAGKRLFARATDQETTACVLSHEVVPPSRHAEGVPRALDDAVMCGLAREKDERFETAREMAIAIEEAIALPQPHEVGEWVTSTAAQALQERELKLAQMQDLSASAPAPAAEARAPKKSRRALGLAVAAVSGALAASVAWRALGDRTPPHEDGVETASALPSALGVAAPAPPLPTSADAEVTPRAGRPVSGQRSRPAPSAPRHADDCDPPYVIDSTGIKIPKRSCL
jgi:serine/threonine-protein kinase